MYVVNIDLPTSTARIHMVGECGHQRPPRTRSETGQSTWSDSFATLDAAETYAHQSGKVHVEMCKHCERSAAFGQ